MDSKIKFSSIKWKFILVYFLLVFIAMVVVGIFIVGKLETQQVSHVTKTMEKHIQNIINTSSYIGEDDWLSVKSEIQNTLDEWRLDSTEVLHVIYGEDIPTVIASSSKQYNRIIGVNALSHRNFDPTLIINAFDGEVSNGIIKDNNEGTYTNHIAYPVLSSVGKVKGVFYMTADLQNVMSTVSEAKKIIMSATLIALLITISLGFLIASSITEPIRDVTKKAEEMARGDFEQSVEVKSDDEIGQLANMFNYLTLKLKDTIEEIDMERSKLDTIFNYMAEGVVAIDSDGYIIHGNPIAMEILDITNEDREKIEKIGNIDLTKVDYNNTEDEIGDEFLALESKVYKVKYAPFKNDKENMGGIIIVFQDMTNEHKLENMRKEFVANVSHELKTPITTIKSYTETLMMDGIEKDTQLKFLSIIDDECDRMTRLVRDLLQLSNLDYKKTKWNKDFIDMNRLLSDVKLKLEPVYREKKQNLILEMDKVSEVYGDMDGIEQVVLNIVSNAIKYTENNGLIHVKLYEEDNFVSVRVEDNGIGIPDEDKDRIFERFYRVEKGRNRNLGGTGLGLAIAKQIVDSHDGILTLDSKFGMGTTIEIKLPAVLK